MGWSEAVPHHCIGDLGLSPATRLQPTPTQQRAWITEKPWLEINTLAPATGEARVNEIAVSR